MSEDNIKNRNEAAEDGAGRYPEMDPLCPRAEIAEERLRLAIKASGQGIFDLDLVAGTATVTPEYMTMLGLDPNVKTFTLQQWESLVHPDDLIRAKTGIAKYLENSEYGHHIEYRIKHADGSWRWISSIGRVAARDTEGRPLQMIGIHTDMTAIRRAELGMKKTEERLSLLLDLNAMTASSEFELFMFALNAVERLTESRGGYFHTYDETTKMLMLTTWSTAARKLCKSAEGIHYPLDLAGIWADSIRQRRVVVHNDYATESSRKGLPEGHFPLIRHLGVPIFDGDRIVAVAGVGNKLSLYDETDIKQIQVFMNDMWKIIARKRSEEALLKAKTELSRIVETSIEGIFRTDADFRIAFINSAGARMLGCNSPAEIIGSLADIYWESPEMRREMLDSLKRDGYLKQFPIVVKKRDGTVANLELSSVALLDEHGFFQGHEGTMRDISERKNLEAQLLHSQKLEAIGTLAGGIAHDFNNMLGALIGFTSLIELHIPEGHAARPHLEQIKVISEKAAALTHGLLAFSRRQTISLNHVNINILISSISKILKRMIGEDIELSMNISSEHLYVMADAGQIEQVMLNLVANARDAMPSGGSLCISTASVAMAEEAASAYGLKRGGRYARISVKDGGCGISEEDKDRIFDPYYTTKAAGKGTGLGLAIVHGIIAQHGGSISVSSSEEGGSEFTIHLPLTKSSPEELAQMKEDPPGGTEKLLIVEDDDVLRKVTMNMMMLRGYRVEGAADGDEAVAAYRAAKDKPDLVIMDLVMPKKSGREAAREILEIDPKANILFMSGYTADHAERQHLQKNKSRFISKPFSPFEILTAIREALDNGRL